MFGSTQETMDKEYHNPLDGKTYVAEWNEYLPKTPRKELKIRVEMTNVRLLTSQDEIAKNISVDDLANFIKKIEASINTSINGAKANGEILLQVSLIFNAIPKYKIGHKGNIADSVLQDIYNQLLEESYPLLKNGKVVFQIHFKVNPA